MGLPRGPFVHSRNPKRRHYRLPLFLLLPFDWKQHFYVNWLSMLIFMKKCAQPPNHRESKLLHLCCCVGGWARGIFRLLFVWTGKVRPPPTKNPGSLLSNSYRSSVQVGAYPKTERRRIEDTHKISQRGVAEMTTSSYTHTLCVCFRVRLQFQSRARQDGKLHRTGQVVVSESLTEGCQRARTASEKRENASSIIWGLTSASLKLCQILGN